MPHVIIIGGGIMGASCAYHLATRGARVTLLEAGEMFGTGSTGLNAGGVRHQFATAVNVQLSIKSLEMIQSLTTIKRCGYLFLLDNAMDVKQFARNVALQNSLDVPSRMLDGREIATLAPELDLTGVIAASWCPHDGLVDPHTLLHAYIARARELGATLRTDSAVMDLEIVHGHVRRVRTASESFDADAVVIAAGPWSARVGAMAAVELPIEPIRRQIAVTEPIPSLRPDFPFVIDFSRALYFHRESGGILTGMSNRDEPPGFDTRVDQDWRLHHLENALERLPMLADVGISAEWAGLYEVTPDDQPILGRLPQVEDLYVCAGFSGHGLMHGPVAGLLMAEEILDGRAHTIDIESLRSTRFVGGILRREYNVV